MADLGVALRYDVPSSARVVNKLLGGKDNYDIDGVVAATVSKRFVVALREARRFLLRAVHVLSTEHGVHQYVDLGCGMPLPPDVGDAATHRGETGRVLYLDHDPLVAVYARALLERSLDRRFALVDITDTAAVLDQITGFLDLDQPIALCLSGTAELLPNATDVLTELTSGLPANTWIIFSHLTDDVFSVEVRRSAENLVRNGLPYQPRDRATVTAMLDRYELLQPGLVAPHHWRPDIGDLAHQAFHPPKYDLSAYAAVGHRQS
ncbi:MULTISPECIES: SAM-dependent methyltransferase [Nocardia]|uniref:SAM-dependent methyltransferase n=1 Tax=Nocardia TaxID=1817 RepID=UPI000BEF8B2A|nr:MULTISPECIES: SAM-dependent methyltransferase [Nocardia]PEH79460.1 hypothetical protein CRM89_28680 [Nocardia sp. FDAARGOS_372]